MRQIFNLVVFIGLLQMNYSCSKKNNDWENNAGTADLSKVVALGGSYFVGQMNNSIYDESAIYNIPNLFFEQLKYGAEINFTQPIINNEGGFGYKNYYSALPYQSKYLLSVYQFKCENQSILLPQKSNTDESAKSVVNNLVRNTGSLYQNLSLPYASIFNFFEQAPNYYNEETNPYFKIVCNKTEPNYSLIQNASMQRPTFSIVWQGFDDIYRYAYRGGQVNGNAIPQAASFETMLDSMLSILTKYNGKVIIGTIPSINYFPFYNYINSQSLMLDSATAHQLNATYGNSPYLKFVPGANGFIAESNTGQLVAGYPNKIKLLEKNEKIVLAVPLDSLKCNGLGVISPIANRYVLDNEELNIITNNIQAYNDVIMKLSAKYSTGIVNMDNIFATLKNGKIINGITFSTEHIKGRFFSTDGFCPSPQGYGILTNQFIEVFNQYFNAQIPFIVVSNLPGNKVP